MRIAAIVNDFLSRDSTPWAESVISRYGPSPMGECHA